MTREIFGYSHINFKYRREEVFHRFVHVKNYGGNSMAKKVEETVAEEKVELEVLRVTSAGKEVYNPKTKEVLIIPHES